MLHRTATSTAAVPPPATAAGQTPANDSSPLVAHAPGRLVAFFLLAFALSWAAWSPVVAASRGLITLPATSALELLGAFGPTLAALLLTFASSGSRGVRALLARLRRWQVAPRWYAFALATPAALSLLATGIHLLLGGQPPDFARPPVLTLYPTARADFPAAPWPLLPFVFLQQLLLGSAMGEELGWRGYALPRLQTRWTPLVAGVVLGALWGLWHLPRLLADSPGPVATALFWLVLGIIPWSILYTWLYNGTGGSLLLPLLLHAATSTTGLFLAAPDAHPLLAPALTWAVAAAVLRANPQLGGSVGTPAGSENEAAS